MGATLCKESCHAFCETIINDNEKEKNSCPWYSTVDVDWNGCRKFPRLPPAGQHPRLFFTKQDIPRIVARFTHSEMAPVLKHILDCVQKDFFKQMNAHMSELCDEELESPTSKETIDMFFKSDDNRNVSILGAYVYGIIYEMPEIVAKAKRAAIFYAKVILRSKEIAHEQDLKGKPYNVWHSNFWDLSMGWLFGGSSLALAYDLMFNELSEDERAIMRNAFTTAVRNRRGWGMGWPTRRIQSNWASYHGDLLIISAVVEDEDGFDPEVFTLFSDLMAHYLDYAFYDSGHPMEDSYVLSLGFREGSLCFLVMALRGHNIFNHPHFKSVWTKWVPFALEPHNSGRVYGGSSGSSWGYPTSAVIAKYAFPKDPIIDHIYRHYMCEKGKKFGRLNKLQSRVAVLAFAIPALSVNLEAPECPERLGLPLDFVCRDRGKVIMRSDWSENAMWFTLDARPDGFLIGHDVCSRGTFVMNADGRSWGFCPEWKHFYESTDYSLPCIDGAGQLHKAPFVKLLDVFHGSCNSTFASADITYAYNWTWTTWAKEGEDYSKKGYEIEPNDPRDFGYNVWWAPNKLYGERNVAFVGLYQWRKRIATVERVMRSAMLVRASRPYVIISDRLKKDNEEHEYSWAMTTPDDVVLLSFDGRDAILTETEGNGRRFMIRSIGEIKGNLDCSFRVVDKLDEKADRDEKARQVVFKCKATAVNFIFVLYSLPYETSEAPVTTWNIKSQLLEVFQPETGETQRISFTEGDRGESVMKVIVEPDHICPNTSTSPYDFQTALI